MAIYRGSGGSTSTTDQATIDQVAEDAATATTKAAEAASSASSASSSASSASTSATSAASSASTATTKASEASTSATNAASSASAASSSATSAASSATSASGSATNAASEAAAALSSKALALDAQTAAETAESNASDHADDAVKAAYGAEDVLQTLSDSSQIYSARHYQAKVGAEVTAAAASATAAAASETAAAASETAAAASATSASGSATTATTKASEASTSATNAATSASTATTKASEAASSATSASGSATTATTKASEASTSATNAATSANTATTKASEAATSATNAASSASSAAASATAAQAAEDAALAALDSFDDRYLGQKTSDPTLDNDGNALVAGALYFNTTDNTMKVYDGSNWLAAYASLSGALIATNNLSDLQSASAARTNLGLGTAATTASTDYVSTSGDSMTGDLSFGDNDKAIFGAGSDLQIYHDGSHNRIDTNTGNLYIRNFSDDQDIYLQSDDGTGGLTTYVHLDGSEGSVGLRHYGTTKLATTSTGIDVTGTVTADGLTVTGDAEVVGSTTATDMSDPMLRVSGTSYTASGTYGLGFHYTDDTTGVTPTYIGYKLNSGSGNTNGHLVFGTRELTTQGSVPLERMRIGHNGDISFYEDTGTTPKFFWDASAERLGIGTSSPSTQLEIKSAEFTDSQITLDNTSSNTSSRVLFKAAGTEYGRITGDYTQVFLQSANIPLAFRTNGAERMRIDSSGNVGIGTSSPVESSGYNSLTINDTTSGYLVLQSNGIIKMEAYVSGGTHAVLRGTGVPLRLVTTSTNQMEFYTNNTERMRIDSSGNVGIGTSSLGEKLEVARTDNDNAIARFSTNNATADIFLESSEGQIRLRKPSGAEFAILNNSNEERMRIDSSGNVGIGTSSPSTALDVNGTVNATAFTGDGSGLTGVDPFPSGTVMLFVQSAAPTGWTKSTTHNNKALRVVSGTVSSGGNAAFTTAFASYTPSGNVSVSGSVSMSGNIGSTTLSVAQMPSHSHSYVYGGTGGPGIQYANNGSNATSNTGSTGGGGSHNHNHNLSGSLTVNSSSFSGTTKDLAVQYVDVIIATKD